MLSYLVSSFEMGMQLFNCLCMQFQFEIKMLEEQNYISYLMLCYTPNSEQLHPWYLQNSFIMSYYLTQEKTGSKIYLQVFKNNLTAQTY